MKYFVRKFVFASLFLIALLMIFMIGTAAADPVAAVEGGASYDTLAAAVEHAPSGGKITLLSDTATAALTVDKTLTVDGGGFTVSGSGNKNAFLVTVVDGGHLTLQNITVHSADGFTLKA